MEHEILAHAWPANPSPRMASALKRLARARRRVRQEMRRLSGYQADYLAGPALRHVALCIAREMELGIEIEDSLPIALRKDKNLRPLRRAIPWRRAVVMPKPQHLVTAESADVEGDAS